MVIILLGLSRCCIGGFYGFFSVYDHKLKRCCELRIVGGYKFGFVDLDGEAGVLLMAAETVSCRGIAESL